MQELFCPHVSIYHDQILKKKKNSKRCLQGIKLYFLGQQHVDCVPQSQLHYLQSLSVKQVGRSPAKGSDSFDHVTMRLKGRAHACQLSLMETRSTGRDKAREGRTSNFLFFYKIPGWVECEQIFFILDPTILRHQTNLT